MKRIKTAREFLRWSINNDLFDLTMASILILCAPFALFLGFGAWQVSVRDSWELWEFLSILWACFVLFILLSGSGAFLIVSNWKDWRKHGVKE